MCCSQCGDWLSSLKRDEHDLCRKCSCKRSERVNGNWLNPGPRGRLKLTDFPRSLRTSFPHLFATFDNQDVAGHIYALQCRPDVVGLRHLSKSMWNTDLSTYDRVCWFLTAHRLYDAEDNNVAVFPWINKTSCAAALPAFLSLTVSSEQRIQHRFTGRRRVVWVCF